MPDVAGVFRMNRSLIASGYLGFVTIGVASSIIAPTLPYIIDTYHINFAQAGSIFSFQFMGKVLAVLSIGLLADIFGKKSVIIFGALAMAAGLFAFSIAHVWGVALLLILLFGFGHGSIDLGFNAVFADAAREKRGGALSLLHVFFGIGALAAPLIAGFIMGKGAKWPPVYWVPSIMATMLMASVLPQKFPVPEAERPRLSDLRFVTSEPRFLILLLIMFFYGATEIGISGWIPAYLTKTMRSEPQMASLTLSLFWAALTSGRLLVAMIIDRLGCERVLKILGTTSLGMALLSIMAPNGGLAAFSFVILGFGLSGIFPTIIALGTGLSRGYSGTASGALIAASSLGGVTFPWLMGLAADAFGLRAGLGMACLAAGGLAIGSHAFANRHTKEHSVR